MNSELRDRIQAWIADDVDPDAVAQLRALVAGSRDAELSDRFSGPLTFGTAGLRGPMRAGPNGMNRTVVRRAAAGLAAWLGDAGHRGTRVIIGYDGRHGSRDFAQDSAAVFAAAGFQTLLLPRMLPTPVLAFAVQRLGAQLGVMVTASHNPAADNGYKVYTADGAQIVSPTDTQIEACIQALGATRAIALSAEYTVLDESLVEDYVTRVAALIDHGPRQLRIVHTAMHGVGTSVISAVFAAAGFAPLIPVVEQSEPDPDFPTVAFPNPEEPGALDLALNLARAEVADIVIANDPDADRCAVAARFGDDWRALTGDEVGVLLADFLIRKGVRGTYATTIVSSTLLRAMAARQGVGYAETLTGFKWVVRAAPDLSYGYEEALGYAVAPELVRDKDGISAALLVAELAAGLKSQGSTLAQRLAELVAEYGLYATDQVSVRVADLAQLTQLMARLRAAPPRELLGHVVDVTDLFPAADVVTLTWPGGRAVVRPSGTEPKLKAYLEVVVADGSRPRAQELLARLRTELGGVLDLQPSAAPP